MKLLIETTYIVSVIFGYIIVLQTNPNSSPGPPWSRGALANRNMMQGAYVIKFFQVAKLKIKEK